MKKIVLIIFRVVSLIIVIGCLLFIYRWYKNNESNKHIQEQISKLVTIENIPSEENSTEERLIIDFKGLKEINPDTVGWVKVNNTNINFSVVQSSDNNYYLKHNFYKESNNAGWIFADCKNSFDPLDKNTILYGHHMKNGIMFGDLAHLLEDSWNFEGNNSYFSFATEEKSYKAEIFSVYEIKASQLVIPNEFENDEEFSKYVQQLKDLSIHDFNVEVDNEDKIVTLCTCGDTNKNRIVVHAKLVE